LQLSGWGGAGTNGCSPPPGGPQNRGCCPRRKKRGNLRHPIFPASEALVGPGYSRHPGPFVSRVPEILVSPARATLPVVRVIGPVPTASGVSSPPPPPPKNCPRPPQPPPPRSRGVSQGVRPFVPARRRRSRGLFGLLGSGKDCPLQRKKPPPFSPRKAGPPGPRRLRRPCFFSSPRKSGGGITTRFRPPARVLA